MYAQLGNIIFEGLIGFDTLDLKHSANYAEMPVIDGRPKLQRIGTNLDDLKLTIKFHVGFCNPEEKVNELMAVWETGEILPFITGAGVVIGEFVLIDVNRTHDQLDGNGQIIGVTIDISLKQHYDPQKQRTNEAKAKENAFAAAGNQPPTAAEVDTPQGPTFDSAQSTVAVFADTTAVEENIELGIGDTDQTETAFARARGYMQNMTNNVNNAINKINETTGDIYTRTRDFESALNVVNSKISSLDTAAEALDTVAARTGLDDLIDSVESLKNSASILAALIAIRR